RELPVGGCIQPHSAEQYKFIVMRKIVGIFIGGMPCQPFSFTTGSRHDEHIEVAVMIPCKGDVLAVATPYRHAVALAVHRQRSGLTAAGRYFVEVAAISENDGASVWGDGGVTQPQGSIRSVGSSMTKQQVQ